MSFGERRSGNRAPSFCKPCSADSHNALARFLSNYILLLTYALDEDYARDNDGYSSINSAMFPRDSFDSRLKSLQIKFQGVEVKKIKQLDSDFVSDLKQVELAKAGFSSARKKQLENLLN